MNIITKIRFTATKYHCLYFQINHLARNLGGKCNVVKYKSRFLNNPTQIHHFLHDSASNASDFVTENSTLNVYYDDLLSNQQNLRSLFYPNSEDPLILKMNDCASVQEILNVIKENSDKMNATHVVQAVIVLWDLHKMACYFSQWGFSLESFHSYKSQLIGHAEFNTLLNLVKKYHEEFTDVATSCVLLYLRKIGLNITHEALQLLVQKLKKCMKNNISLSAVSRFTVAAFTDESSLMQCFLLQDATPIVIDALDKCNTVEDLKLITICLNYLNHIVSDEYLQKYEEKVRRFLDENAFNLDNYRAILKIISWFDTIQSYETDVVLLSRLLFLFKNNINKLGTLDYIILFEVFFKYQEPGELLTEMQRCASRFLLQANEQPNLPTEVKLKLLLSIICFSSPNQRLQYEKTVAALLNNQLTATSMIDLIRIVSFIKKYDSELNNALWNNILTFIEDSKNTNNVAFVMKLIKYYLNYSNELNYRHKKFEAHIIRWLQHEADHGIITIIPSTLAITAAFTFSFADKEEFIKSITQQVADNWEQFNYIDVLYISKGLELRNKFKNLYVGHVHINTVNNAINKTIVEKLMPTDTIKDASVLLKSCIYRKCSKELSEQVLLNIKPDQKMSSVSIGSLAFILQSTNALLPDLMDSIANYVIQNRDMVLGFNAEKVACLFYFLSYWPKYSDELFHVVTDIIIRDQGRLSGLSYLNTALALCFFHKLPDSFIKQIFNVAFLDKLDEELATCYSKNIYPLRVRRSMMELNRAVCLDYPYSNVPWFHQKYIEQLHKKGPYFKGKEAKLRENLKMYLQQIVGKPEYLVENAVTPYGYHVDFEVCLAADGKFTNPNECKHGIKVALLLMKPSAYTEINVQLKGKYQLKNRHLEIMGYKVLAINSNEWESLVYGKEKVDYLAKLLYPDYITKKLYSVVDR